MKRCLEEMWFVVSSETSTASGITVDRTFSNLKENFCYSNGVLQFLRFSCEFGIFGRFVEFLHVFGGFFPNWKATETFPCVWIQRSNVWIIFFLGGNVYHKTRSPCVYLHINNIEKQTVGKYACVSVCLCACVSMFRCVCVCVWKCDKHCCGVVPGLGCHLSLLISLINPSQPPFIPSTNININKWHIVDQIILHKFGKFHSFCQIFTIRPDWRIVFKKMFQKNLSTNDYFDS